MERYYEFNEAYQWFIRNSDGTFGSKVFNTFEELLESLDDN